MVGGILGCHLNAHRKFFEYLTPAAQLRCQERDLKNLGHEVPKRVGGNP